MVSRVGTDACHEAPNGCAGRGFPQVDLPQVSSGNRPHAFAVRAPAAILSGDVDRLEDDDD